MEQQIQQLIEQLDEKIAAMNTSRTDPNLIASQISSNLQSFLGVYVNNFLSKKQQEEQQLQKPRSVIQNIIPIDVVSVSETAAGQIADALAAAGIGRYKLNINQVATESTESTGMLGSIMNNVTSIVSWVASTFKGFLLALGPFLKGMFVRMMSSMGGFTRFFGGRLGKVLGVAAGTAALMTMFNTDQIPDNIFSDQIDKLQQIESEPTGLFESSSPIAEPPSVESITQTDDFKNIQSQTIGQDTTSTDALDNFLSDTKTGNNYVSAMLEQAGTSRETESELIRKQSGEIERDFQEMFQLSGMNEQQKDQLRSSYNQAISQGGIDAAWLREHQEFLVDYQDPDGAALEAAIARMEIKYGNNIDESGRYMYSADPTRNNTLRDVYIGDDTTKQQVIDNYLNSSNFLEQKLTTTQAAADNFTDLQNSMNNINTSTDASSGISDMKTQTAIPSPSVDMLQPPPISIPQTTSTSPQSRTAQQTRQYADQLASLINSKYKQDEQMIEYLESINNALLTTTHSDETVTNNNLIQDVDDVFNIEVVRNMAKMQNT